MRVNGRPSIHHGHLCTSLGRAHDPSVRQLPLPTLRERAVLHALVDGLTSTESAARLGRAPRASRLRWAPRAARSARRMRHALINAIPRGEVASGWRSPSPSKCEPVFFTPS
jgi:hypothetical protein